MCTVIIKSLGFYFYLVSLSLKQRERMRDGDRKKTRDSIFIPLGCSPYLVFSSVKKDSSSTWAKLTPNVIIKNYYNFLMDK